MKKYFIFILAAVLVFRSSPLMSEDGKTEETKEADSKVTELSEVDEDTEQDTDKKDSEQQGEETSEGDTAVEKKITKKQRPFKILQDPRGRTDLTLCSQNLENYGTQKSTMLKLGITAEEYLDKQKALAERIVRAKCDVIALQEIVSKSEEEGRLVLNELGKAVSLLGGRHFDVKAGSSNESTIRNGFMVAKDRAEIVNTLSYSKVELPKISDKQKPRFFLRSPVEIQITARSVDEGRPKTITLITFHLKSKSGSARDPAELQWETYRMEMSEAIRRIVEVRHRKSLISPDNLLVVMGDRNANFDMASAHILEGKLRLSDFKADSFCRLSKRGVPLCKPGAQSAPVLFSVLTSDPHAKLFPGTYTYRKVYSWIDDILLSSEALPFAWANYDKAADYDSGVIYEPKKASDHAMVYVRLNW